MNSKAEPDPETSQSEQRKTDVLPLGLKDLVPFITPLAKRKACELCGWHHPSRKGYGLEEAHILADGFGPRQRWNILTLCPNCHTAFDMVIKPRLIAALCLSTKCLPANGVDGEVMSAPRATDIADAVTKLVCVRNAPLVLPKDFGMPPEEQPV